MRLLNSLTRELVSNIIVLAVDMTDGPGTAAKGLPLNRGIQEGTEVVAVAAPMSQHEHHN